jgi:hypothetical protein
MAEMPDPIVRAEIAPTPRGASTSEFWTALGGVIVPSLAAGLAKLSGWQTIAALALAAAVAIAYIVCRTVLKARGIAVLAFALLVPQVAHAQARVIAPGVVLPEVQVVQDQQQSAGGAGAAETSRSRTEPQAVQVQQPPAAALDPRVPLDLAKLSAGLQATQTTLTSIMSQLGIKPTLPAGFCDAGAGKAVCIGFTVTGIVISALGAGVATYAAVK